MMSGNGNKVFLVLFKESASKPKDRLKSSLISPLGSMLSDGIFLILLNGISRNS